MRLRRVLIVLASVLAAAALVLVVRGWSRVPEPVTPAPDPALAIDADAALARLAAAIRHPTISRDEPGTTPAAALEALIDQLREDFPRVHAALEVERINRYSLLLRWAGRDPRAPAVLFAGHLDVVPVEERSEAEWTHPPFAGVIADGHLWGRGTMDDKGSVLALLEAVDALLARGHRPAVDHYFAFGHDEEIGGREGAAHIAQALRARGVELEFVLDEGTMVLEDVLPVAAPVALVGIAERGFATVELTARGTEGHSALPATDNAVERLARALTRLEGARSAPRLTPATRALFERLAPESDAVQRVLLGNADWLGPVLARGMAAAPLTRATVESTITPTVLRGGQKDNAVPGIASARLNLRLLTGERAEDIVARLVAAIDDEKVSVQLVGEVEPPSAVSSTQSRGYRAIRAAVARVFPDAVTAPGLMIATTDTKHYAPLARDVYRFMPLRARSADLARYHGRDERIAVSGYVDAIRFYVAVMLALSD